MENSAQFNIEKSSLVVLGIVAVAASKEVDGTVTVPKVPVAAKPKNEPNM